MASLHKLNQGNRVVFVGFMGQKIAVEYDVKGYDDTVYVESVRKNKLDEDNPQRLRINNTIIRRMVKAWDLTEDDCPESCQERKDERGDPICREHAIPVTPEAIAALPNMLVGRIVTRIMEDASADSDDPKLSLTASRNGS